MHEPFISSMATAICELLCSGKSHLKLRLSHTVPKSRRAASVVIEGCVGPVLAGAVLWAVSRRKAAAIETATMRRKDATPVPKRYSWKPANLTLGAIPSRYQASHRCIRADAPPRRPNAETSLIEFWSTQPERGWISARINKGQHCEMDVSNKTTRLPSVKSLGATFVPGYRKRQC